MHVEPTEEPPENLKEFFKHYAMIVLSILTALALEQAVLGLEHRHEGARAKDEIEQEIAWNHAAIAQALQSTRENRQAWNAVRSRTLDDIHAGRSTNDSRVAALREAGKLFHDATPTLKTTAWDAAIADQAVNYLAHADLTRYSELYVTQRELSQWLAQTTRDGAVRNLTDLTLAETTSTADVRSTLEILTWRSMTLSVAESDLEQLDATTKAVPGDR